ncbi:phosphate signaling complex PhoU family protein [Nocardia nova]|jgi:phosphate transport system protein|uniref:phosphate signaling complex PhoU family protein n=1 Tax=Nocardia nova TaxID=37330 RepID=UPI0025B21BF6|nr:PhoU domain-containing protein [Nocardia nova]
MQSDYHANLRQLAELLYAMCERDRIAIAAATHAVVNADIDQAEAAVDLVGQVEIMQREAEQEVLRLLALRAPVAGELRLGVTAIQLSGNLHCMAVLAGHIAISARRRHPDHVVPGPVRPLIERIGSTALAIATDAAAVLDTGDPDAAAGLDARDDTMYRLHEQLLAVVLDHDWVFGITAAVDLTLLGRYYERFADNAVEVGRRTIFLPTGETTHRPTPKA